MKSRASLLLMEQLVMVLVFSLAAAACLGLFGKAHTISRETARRNEAVLLAQSAAEQLKRSGDPERVAEHLETGEYDLVIREENETIPNFRQAEITVFYEETELFTLRTGWQEVAP